MAVIDKGAVTGWRFCKYKDKSGQLVTLAQLRKQGFREAKV
ncbi:MAG TPA: hypothetical protein VMW16_07760 [Sedimentisphaerales bacterium]|nr:hypothetical protein [Sedimentisphaerales bacterium]